MKHKQKLYLRYIYSGTSRRDESQLKTMMKHENITLAWANTNFDQNID